MEKSLKNISVAHLVYVPFGLKYFKVFITSYKKFTAGFKHKLLLIFKGFLNKNEANDFIDFAKDFKIEFEILFYEKEGFDINAYKWTSEQINADVILFINSKSRILAPSWLDYYIKAWENNPNSVIGATGSYQSYLSSVFQKNKCLWEKSKSFKQNFDKYKLFVKAALLWRFYFKPFPNPHIRTNAFLIDRELFLSLQFPEIRTKLDAYRFESGRNGFTAQLLKKKYEIILIDKFGKTYQRDKWALSKIFWQDKQENLLVADNQTDAYEQSDLSEQKMLAYLAWGNKKYY